MVGQQTLWRGGAVSDQGGIWVTWAKCGLENVKDGSPCPRCAGLPSLESESNANSPISEDFLLGNTKVGLERIRARLLDLTNRNRLLNFRHTLRSRSSLAIVGVLPDALFDNLIEGDSVTFKPVPPLQNLRLQRRGSFLYRPSTGWREYSPASRSASKRPFQRLI
jgi:Protein of unknown function (DUF4011)